MYFARQRSGYAARRNLLATFIRIVAFPVLAFLLAPLAAHADDELEVFLVNGEEYSFERSLQITFWTTPNPYSPLAFERSYQTADGELQQRLIENAQIEAPPGIAVREDSLQVYAGEETFSFRMNRTETTVTSECTVIEGRWSFVVPDDFEPGEYEIIVRFPNAEAVRDALGAEWPTYVPAATLRFRTARTEEERSENRWLPSAKAGAAYLAGGLLLGALVAGAAYLTILAPSIYGLFLIVMVGFPSWIVWRGHFENSGIALHDAWSLSPVPAIVAILLTNAVTTIFVWFAGGRAGWSRTWEHLLAAVLFVGPQIVGYIWLSEQNQADEAETWRYAWATLSYTPGIVVGWALLTCSARERFEDKLSIDAPASDKSSSPIISPPPGME